MALILTATLCWTASAATVVTDFKFDHLETGATLPVTYGSVPSVDPFPQGTVYATGGFPSSGPLTGTVTVQDVGGLQKAAFMETTQGGTGALYIDTQMQVLEVPWLTISFDLHIVEIPNEILPQAVAGAPNGQAFAMNVFGWDPVVPLMRFAVAPTSDTGGDLVYRLPGMTGEVVKFGDYEEGGTYNLSFELDYISRTLDIILDGYKVVEGAALLSDTSYGLAEIFLFQNGVEGSRNAVAIDNIYTTAAPEPSRALLMALGVGALALRRRRKFAR